MGPFWDTTVYFYLKNGFFFFQISFPEKNGKEIMGGAFVP